MAPPSSFARALHDIITDLDGQIGRPILKSPYEAWTAIVGEPVESAVFARFHAEVLTLLREVSESLTRLAPSSQERYEQYLPQWWAAVVMPRVDWAVQGNRLIEQSALDMLGAMADVLEARALLAGPANPQTVEIVRKAVSLLLGEIEGASEVPLQVREQIVADLKHVLWLLEHVDTFGVDHSIVALEKVTGKVVAEATKSPSKTLKRVAIGLATTLALLTPVTTDVATLVGNVRSVFGITSEVPEQAGAEDVVQATVVQIYNVCTPKELPPGRAAPDEDEPVEAEIMGDGEGRP